MNALTSNCFGTVFYLLVFFAALTSSIGMLEGAVSAFMDRAEEKGKTQKDREDALSQVDTGRNTEYTDVDHSRLQCSCKRC